MRLKARVPIIQMLPTHAAIVYFVIRQHVHYGGHSTHFTVNYTPRFIYLNLGKRIACLQQGQVIRIADIQIGTLRGYVYGR